MAQRVEVPGVGVIEFPDGMHHTEIAAAIERSFPELRRPQPAVDPTEGMGGLDKFAAGFGKSLVDTWRGVKQLFNIGDQEALKQTIADERELSKPLQDTGAGLAGEVVGQIGQVLAPGGALLRGGRLAQSAGKALLNPQTYKGAAAQGGAFGLAQPSLTDSETAANVGFGAAGGALGRALAGATGAAVKPRVVGLNDQQQRVLKEAEELGFKALPSQRTGSGALRVAEAGLSRTIGGSGAFTGVAKHNQTLINRLASKELGRESDTVTRELLDDVQSELGKKYDALRSVERVELGDGFRAELGEIMQEQASRPEVLRDPAVVRLVEGLANTTEMTGSSFVAATKALRKQAKDAFRAGNSEVGHAKKAIAEALEGAAQPVGASPSAVVDFKKARHKYSKLLAIESTINERGDVSAAKLATALKKQNPKRYGKLSSDLEVAAAFEKMFPPMQSSGTVEGAQAIVSGGAMLADPTLGALTLAGPFMASRGYTTRAGGALAEAPIRAIQGVGRGLQHFNPTTARQRAIAELLRSGTIAAGSTLPALSN